MNEIMEEAPRPARAAGDADAAKRADLLGRALPRRRFFNDMPDKGLFGFVALGGFVGIIALKAYSTTSSELIAALAVVIMVGYGMIAFRMPAVQMRPDRLGDNFYYIGFIYTLASLSASLLQLRTAPLVEELLGNFGIALVTTVVGVAGRVLFAQMRGDIDDVEERVRRDLVAASADLRAQLVLALREFETFHLGVLQATGEKVEEATEEVENRIAKIGDVTEAAIGRIRDYGRAHETSLEKLDELLVALGKSVAALTSLAAHMQNAALLLSKSSRSGRRRWYWPFSRYR